MQLNDAIQNRASIKVFSDEAVPLTVIESCLDAAVWAPNHHLTEPWRFFVIPDEARELLAQAVATHVNIARGLEWAQAKAQVIKERKHIFSAPTIIAIYSDMGTDQKTEKENLCATAAAIQNLLLTAHSLGYGAIWRTSDIYDYPTVRQVLQVPPSTIPVGAIFIGKSAQREVPRRRRPHALFTTWVGASGSGTTDETTGAGKP